MDGPRERGTSASFRSRPPARASTLASARGVATTVLHRVATDQAYAAHALDAEIARAKLSSRDARLATEIVYGTLRMLPELDARLDQQLARGRPEPFTWAALRGATYQALALDRVPSFAIVQETVALVKEKRGERLAKLTNAVLRRIVEARVRAGERSDVEAGGSAGERGDVEAGGSAGERSDVRGPSLGRGRASVPSWIEASLREGLGDVRTERYLELAQRPPPLSLRVRVGSDRASVLAALRAARPDAELRASALSPDVILAVSAGDPRKLPGYREGWFVVQDEGAALVGKLVGAEPGERVLDACAGRGGKTLQLLEALGEAGELTAIDLHARKLAQLEAELTRLGYPSGRVHTETIDLSVGTGDVVSGFDRVLVDAPCTGLGTLRRRPELLLRLQPEDPARLGALQRRILTAAAALVRPGGKLVYAVCSGTRIESQEVALALESTLAGWRRLTEQVAQVSVACEGDGVFRIGPWLTEAENCPDVYQVVRWEKLDSHVGHI